MNFKIPLEDVESMKLDGDGEYVVVVFKNRGTVYPAVLHVSRAVTMMVKAEEDGGVLEITY